LIDRRQRFRFVDEGTRVEGGVHFDMANAEFTHGGEDCTFETVVKEFGFTRDPALGEIAEVVHDVDLKDGKFNRLEAAGINLAVRGLASVVMDDRKLVRQAAVVFDGLYEYLGRKGARGERDEGRGNAAKGAMRGGKARRK
jgi:hypothetical protein